MPKGNVTVRETYVTAQTDTVVVSPATPKRLTIWDITLESDSASVLKFATSGIVIAETLGSEQIRVTAKYVGDIDENVIITCGTNTEVSFLFDESL